jgi:hypothetical protein
VTHNIGLQLPFDFFLNGMCTTLEYTFSFHTIHPFHESLDYDYLLVCVKVVSQTITDQNIMCSPETMVLNSNQCGTF